MKVKIEIKEPVFFRLIQTGEIIEFKEAGVFEIENDLKAERIVAQSNGKIDFIKEKKKKKENNG